MYLNMFIYKKMGSLLNAYEALYQKVVLEYPICFSCNHLRGAPDFSKVPNEGSLIFIGSTSSQQAPNGPFWPRLSTPVRSESYQL